MTSVRVEGVSKFYGRFPALRGVSFTLESGRVAAVLGPNGAGKSTLLGILSTLMRPTSGKVDYGALAADRQLLRGRIGLLSHRTFLYEDLSGRENLALFARLYAIASAARRVGDLLAQVGMTECADQLVRTYSRGMQQRVAAARALLGQPNLLLLDEPFTGLDQAGTLMLRDLLREQMTAGVAVVLVTHDLEIASELARHVVILRRGAVVCERFGELGYRALRELYHDVTRDVMPGRGSA